MKKMNGFTLAEVLITLGIIGVVAAMTMPTLINQTNGAQYKAAYKKALSAISQGVTLNVALEDLSFADGDAQAILKDRMNIVKTVKDDANGLGYSIKTGDTNGLKDGAASNITLFFNDGSVFQYAKTATKCTKDNPDGTNTICKGFIDVNGAKGPNKEVVCDSVGTTAGTPHTANCKVTSPTDIYPVMYYDQTILPNSQAASAVLYGK